MVAGEQKAGGTAWRGCVKFPGVAGMRAVRARSSLFEEIYAVCCENEEFARMLFTSGARAGARRRTYDGNPRHASMLLHVTNRYTRKCTCMLVDLAVSLEAPSVVLHLHRSMHFDPVLCSTISRELQGHGVCGTTCGNSHTLRLYLMYLVRCCGEMWGQSPWWLDCEALFLRSPVDLQNRSRLLQRCCRDASGRVCWPQTDLAPAYTEKFWEPGCSCGPHTKLRTCWWCLQCVEQSLYFLLVDTTCECSTDSLWNSCIDALGVYSLFLTTRRLGVLPLCNIDLQVGLIRVCRRDIQKLYAESRGLHACFARIRKLLLSLHRMRRKRTEERTTTHDLSVLRWNSTPPRTLTGDTLDIIASVAGRFDTQDLGAQTL